MSARSDAITWTMSVMPGVTYGRPNGFSGNRPIYFDDLKYLRAREDSRSWLMDPEGIHGLESEFAGWNLTPTRTTTPPWDIPDPWLLPAVTTGYSNPDDIVGSWGILEPDGGLSYDVHRGGYLTPRLPGIGLPSAALLALSPYKLSDFRVGATTTPPVVLPSPGTSTPPATTPKGPAGNPITGNPADRFLVNGTTYDGTGKALSVDKAAVVSSTSTNNNLILAAVLAAGLYAFSRTTSRR